MAMGNICLPQDFKIVTACPTTTTNGTVTCDNISLKDAQMAWIIFEFLNPNGHACVINPLLGANVTTCATVPTFNCRYWENAAILATDTLVAGTSGTTYTISAAATNSLVVVQVDPAEMANQGATLDCLGCTITGGAHAADFVTGTYIIQERYAQATPRSAILD